MPRAQEARRLYAQSANVPEEDDLRRRNRDGHLPLQDALGSQAQISGDERAEWLELLCRHIPDRNEHLVCYVGWNSNRARSDRGPIAVRGSQGVEASANSKASSDATMGLLAHNTDQCPTLRENNTGAQATISL